MNYQPSMAPTEEAERLVALENVSVNELGVAECRYAGSIIRLAGVRITEGSGAQQVPFEQNDHDGKLDFALPVDRPSVIGFFVDSTGPKKVTGATVRTGDYSAAEPILLASPWSARQQPVEAFFKLRGVLPNETEEQQWADEIGLYDRLGFRPKACRGIFSRGRQARLNDNDWLCQRIVATPQGVPEAPTETTISTNYMALLQILAYRVEVLTPKDRQPVGDRLEIDNRLPTTYGNGISLGFGPTYNRELNITWDNYLGTLRGAFEVAVVPESYIQW